MRSIRSKSSRVLRPSLSNFVTQHHVPGLERGHQLRQLRPIGPRAAYILPMDRFGRGGLQGLELTGQMLILRAHPRVADNRQNPEGCNGPPRRSLEAFGEVAQAGRQWLRRNGGPV